MDENYDALPPLPDLLCWDQDDAESSRVQTRLPAGCYYLRFHAPGNSHAELLGTLRVEHSGSNIIASGDAYFHLTAPTTTPVPASQGSFSAPSPSAGVPIFPRGAYRNYLRVTSLAAGAASADVSVAFEAWEYEHSAKTWTNRGNRTLTLVPRAAPSGFAHGTKFLSGEVRQGGALRGTLDIGWVSRYLRRAKVEVDRVSVAEAPRTNGAGIGWQSVFDHVAFQITVVESSNTIAEPSGESWSDAELHASMLASRDRSNLDDEWRYHLLCVRRLDSTTRGIMYDAYGSDSNNIPREGAAIASHWVVPNENEWGSVRGQRFGLASSPYFRTAVHEMSHALGLYHPPASDPGTHIMQATNVIASSATSSSPFPSNIVWRHSASDQKRLRHLPDHWVRPGGQSFGGSYSSVPISVDAEDGFVKLEVRPLLESVPIGAPVRVQVTLINCGTEPIQVPRTFSLKAGVLSGSVRGPQGADRSFQTCVLCVDEEPELQTLGPSERITRDETLLRGRDGALFDSPGLHTIHIEAQWDVAPLRLRASAETTVLVLPALDAAHASAARTVLSSRDLLITLAVGGDHLPEAQHALSAALADATLRPHYVTVEAVRLSQRFFDRPPHVDEAARLLTDEVVASPSERGKLQALFDAAPTRTALADAGSPVSRNGAPKQQPFARHDESPTLAF